MMVELFDVFARMLRALLGVLDAQALFLIVTLLLAVRAFGRAVKSGPIELWHFYATKTGDGQHYGDPNKLGIMVGIFASTLMVGYSFWAHAIDNWYVVAVFFIWLAFIAGAEYFSKWFRTIAAKVAEKRLGAAPEKPEEPKP